MISVFLLQFFNIEMILVYWRFFLLVHLDHIGLRWPLIFLLEYQNQYFIDSSPFIICVDFFYGEGFIRVYVYLLWPGLLLCALFF